MWGVFALGLILVFGFAQANPGLTETAYVSNSGGGRVVGGWESSLGQFPHYVSMRMVATDGLVSLCGASLIHPNWLITAAHCVANRITFLFRFGVAELSRPTLVIEETSENVFLHPEYDPTSMFVQRDDIALFKLSRYIPYGPTIQPIRLQSSAQRNNDYDGQTLTISGVGLTNDIWNGGDFPDVVRWVYLRGMTNTDCRNWFVNVYDQTICATYYNSTIQGACTGDSGGPLTVVDDDGELTLIGVVSFTAFAGCSSAYPSGFVRPGHYHDWITHVTNINFDWSSSPVSDSEYYY